MTGFWWGFTVATGGGVLLIALLAFIGLRIGNRVMGDEVHRRQSVAFRNGCPACGHKFGQPIRVQGA